MIGQAETNNVQTPDGVSPFYSFDQFQQDVQKIQPRFFDTYLLAPFMLWYAYSSKTPMNRWPRRILFTAGIYMLYRNYTNYQKAYRELYTYFLETQRKPEQEQPV